MALQGVLGNVLGDGDHAAPGNVLQGVVYNNGGLIGTYDPGAGGVVPDANDVRLGVAVGVQPNFGTVRLPDEADVKSGVTYDANDSRTGTLAVVGVPRIEDVRFGVIFGENDSLTGVLQLPSTGQVLVGVGYGAYGTEFEGTLVDVPGGTGAVVPPVNMDGSIKSPLIIGDDYSGDRAFLWQISPPSGFDIVTTNAYFRGWQSGSCDCPTSYDWDVRGLITDTAGIWDLKFEISSAKSSQIARGEYDWAVVIEDNGVQFTISGSHQHFTVDWIC